MRKESSNTSKGILAIILIAIGMLWLLSQIGIHFNIPKIHFEHIFYPIHSLFKNFGHIIFSWPSLLIIIGLILMAGNRRSGVVLIVIGGIFLLPRIFFVPGITISILLPVVLIAIGISMVVRKH